LFSQVHYCTNWWLTKICTSFSNSQHNHHPQRILFNVPIITFTWKCTIHMATLQ
jgi:hypothetical protein